MVDIDTMFKALKLAWIPRLLIPGNQSWKTVPDYYLRKFGGLNFLLRCNYDARYIKSIPLFYRNILAYFNELKTLYDFDQAQDIILFNNKEMTVMTVKPFLSGNGSKKVSCQYKISWTIPVKQCPTKNLRISTSAKLIFSNIIKLLALFQSTY